MALVAPYLDDLSVRELQCLKCAAEDMSIEETASKLFLSADTVKTHRKMLLKKFKSRTMGRVIYLYFYGRRY